MFNPLDDTEIPAGFNFIETYKQIHHAITDASDDFIEAAALFLLSTAVGRQYGIWSLPEYQVTLDNTSTVSVKYLNLWFLLIGKSRIARKTTVTSKVQNVLYSVCPERLCAHSFTPEALITELSQKYDKSYNGCLGSIVIDDSATFFSSLARDYMKSTAPLLSTLYNCMTFKRRTKTYSLEEVVNPYVAMFLNATPNIHEYFEKTFFEQGYANRIMYIFGERDKKRTRIPLDDKLRLQILAYIHKLKSYPQALTILKFTPEVSALHEQKERELDERVASNELGLRESWIANTPEFIMKVSALHRLARFSETDFSEIRSGKKLFVEIGLEDYNFATAWVEKAEKSLDKLLRLMNSPRTKPVVSDTATLEAIYEWIAEMKQEGIQRSVLLDKSGKTAKEFDEYIRTLIEAKRVVMKTLRTGGRPQVRYYATEYTPSEVNPIV